MMTMILVVVDDLCMIDGRGSNVRMRLVCISAIYLSKPLPQMHQSTYFNITLVSVRVYML